MDRPMVAVSGPPTCLSNGSRTCRAGIIRAMTERGMAHPDGAPACPFVAFEDDRDERSDRPDHRHRCYAEVHPAPRAIAHQEAYCLSSAFAVCPTFQDWAQREAARTRGGAGTAVPPPGATVAISQADDHRHDTQAERPPEREDAAGPPAEPAAEWQGPPPATRAERDDGPAPLPPRRNPPRDWAAPPPWATGPGMSSGAGAAGAAAAAGAGAGAAGAGTPPPQFLAEREARGLAGSTADRVAGGQSFVDPPRQLEDNAPSIDQGQPSQSPERAQEPDAELAGLVGGRPPARPPEPYVPRSYEDDPGQVRYEGARPPSRPPNRDQQGAPSWEQPRHYEAYPTIKTRASIPGLPRLGVMAAALGIAALALFFLPSILDLFGGIGGGPGAGNESPAPSAPVESVVPSPTVPPAPTPQVYIVKSGDTMSKIAKRFDVSIDELIAANKDTIKDPDKISIGDTVIIPVPGSAEDPGGFLGSDPPASTAP
jgi:nucleoid-associated protein YgaU